MSENLLIYAEPYAALTQQLLEEISQGPNHYKRFLLQRAALEKALQQMHEPSKNPVIFWATAYTLAAKESYFGTDNAALPCAPLTQPRAETMRKALPEHIADEILEMRKGASQHIRTWRAAAWVAAVEHPDKVKEVAATYYLEIERLLRQKGLWEEEAND